MLPIGGAQDIQAFCELFRGFTARAVCSRWGGGGGGAEGGSERCLGQSIQSEALDGHAVLCPFSQLVKSCVVCALSRFVWVGGWPQLVRCGPATVAPAAPAPRPSLLSQFITCSSGQWPCLCSKQFHVPASLAG